MEPLATHVGILFSGKLAFAGSVGDFRSLHGDGLPLEALYQRLARSRRAAIAGEVLA
jgi:hypothetical protein